MPIIVMLHDLVEANGKTIKENNLEKKHELPIGALVEVNADYLPEHRTRQFIAAHQRDCDGGPLYAISPNRNMCDDKIGTDEGGEFRTLEDIDAHRQKYYDSGWSGNALILIDLNDESKSKE